MFTITLIILLNHIKLMRYTRDMLLPTKKKEKKKSTVNFTPGVAWKGIQRRIVTV